MGKTLLQMVQTAQRELGLPVSLTVINNNDPSTLQLYAFLQLALEELRKVNDKGWTVLQKEYNILVNTPVTTYAVVTENSRVVTIIPSVSLLGITSTNFNTWAISGAGIPPAARIASIDSDSQITMTMAATASSSTSTLLDYVYDMFGNIIYDMFGDPILNSSNTFSVEQIQFGQDTYAMPSDFDFYQNYTWWDRTNHWMLLGPDSPQVDQWHRSGIVATGPRRHFRNSGQYPSNYRLWPPPFELTDPLQVVFEYMSSFAVQVQGNQYSFALDFANDSDTCLLDDRALIMSMKWRFWEQKGMNWASKRKEYDDRVNLLMAQDGGAETLSLAGRRTTWLLSGLNVQDGYFPGPVGSS